MNMASMKKLLTAAIMMMAPVLMSAQVKHGSEYELGAGVSIYGITGSVGGPSRNPGPTAYFGYGYRFHDNFNAFLKVSYKNGNGKTDHDGINGPAGAQIRNTSYRYNQMEGMAGIDYTLLPNRLVRPFVGAGIGGGVMLKNNKTSNTHHSRGYGIAGPRIGLSIWRIRLSADLCYAFDAESGFESEMSSKAFTIGFMF